MSMYRKQPGVTNFRQYQAPPTSKIATSNSSNKSYHSYGQSSYSYSSNYQKREERVPLNLTNYRANIIPNNTSNTANTEKLNSSFSPILSYQFSHRVNYSKNFDKKDEPNTNYISKSYVPSSPNIIKSITPIENPSPSPPFQIAKSNNSNKDSESCFRPTSYHLKYSNVSANFQYKDDYKPTEYVTKSSAVSSQLLKSIQEQKQNQNQSQNQNQTFDPNSNDQEKPNFDYNASLFFAKQALLNGSNYKQYRNDDFDQKDSSQSDLNQNYDISKPSQSNYNAPQFNLNNNDNNNSITSYYSKSNAINNDLSYKNNFNFNNNNNDLYNNDNKNNYSFGNNSNTTNNNNNNENEFDDDFLAKLKKSISSSVSGDNPNAKSGIDSKYDRDSFTSFHLHQNNDVNDNSFNDEVITIDIPKKKERVDPIPIPDTNENGIDLQAKLAKFRQTISLVRKTEEDYGDMFPQEKKTEDNTEKEGDELTLKDANNDMLSEPSLIFADSPNQS